MKKNQEANERRRRAELKLGEKDLIKALPKTRAEIEEFVHELQAHQAGLEMQIEEQNQARAQAEAALHQYSDLMENSQDLICAHDLQGNLLFVNPSGTRLSGYSKETLLKMNLSEVLAPHVRHKFSEYLAQVQAQGQARGILKIQTASGEIRYLEYDNTLRVEGVPVPIVYAIARDITERKLAEEKLRQSEVRYRSLFEQTHDAVFILDMEGNHYSANQRAADMLGYTLDEIQNLSVRETSAEITKSESLLKRLSAGEHIPPYERLFRKKNGEIFPAEVNVELVRDTKGNFLHILSMVRDITERKQTEEARQLAEKEYRTIFEKAPVGIIQSNPEGRYIKVNSAMARIYGYDTPEEMLASITDIAHQIYVDPSSRLEFMRLLAEKEEVLEFISKNQRRDGSHIWTSVNARTVKDADGKILYYEGFVRDITEQRRVEEKLHLQSAALDAAANTIVITDHEGLIEWANFSFTTLTGFDSSEAIGKNPGKLIKSGKQDQTFYKTLWDTILSGQVWQGELVNRRKDGSFYNEEMTITPLRNPQGEISHFIAVKQDITRRKQVEKNLSESQAQLTGIFNSAMDAIISTDADQRIVIFNPAAEAVFGCRQSEAIGQPLELFIPQQFHAIHRKHMQRFAESGMTNRMIGQLGTVIGLRRNGEEFPIEASISKIRLAGSDLFTIILRDVTERKRAEETLRQREEQYRTLVEQVPAIVYIDDATMEPGQTLYVSPQIETILGITPDEWLQGDLDIWTAHIHPDDCPRILTDYLRCFTDGEPMDSEYRMIAGDGRLLWIREQAARLCDESSKPRLIHGMMYDITERKQADEALREAEIKYRMLVERLPVIVYTSELGANGNWPYVGPQIEQLLGFTPQEWMSDPELWYRQVHPEDRDRQELLEEKAYARGEPFVDEYRIFTRDGRQIWIRDSAQILPPQGGGAPIVQGVLMDVTERKQAEESLRMSEEKYRTLIEQLPAIIYVDILDGKGTTLFISPQVEAILGVSVKEWTEGDVSVWRDLIHPEDRQQIAEAYQRYKKIGQPYEHEYRMITRGGKLIWIQDKGKILESSTGELLLHGVMFDISERKQAEEALQKSESSLHAVLQSTADGILAVGSGNEVLYANERFVEIWRIPQAAMASKDDSVLLQHVLDQLSDPQSFLKKVQELYKSKEESLDALYFKDGRVFERLSRPLLHGTELRGRVWSFRDITERKRAELELQHRKEDLELINTLNELVNRGESLEKLIDTLSNEARRIYSAHVCSVFLLSPDGKVLTIPHLTISPSIIEKLEQTIGQPMPQLQVPIKEGGYIQKRLKAEQGVITSDPKLIQQWILEFGESTFLASALRGLVRKLIPQIFKFLNVGSTITVPLISANKTIGLLELASSGLYTPDDLARVRNISGQVTAAILQNQDKQALTASEAELRALFASMQDVVLVIDREGVYRKIAPTNPALLVRPADELLGRNLRDVFPAEQAQDFIDSIRRVLKTRQTAHIEYELTIGGRLTWFSASISPMTEESTLWVARDVTERKQAEELVHQYAGELEMRVEERTAELVHANRTKDEFLANMSHELRTPLNGILGFSETLLGGIYGPINEGQHQAVEVIYSSGEHLLGLINDILDVSKIEAGKFEFRPENIEVHEICQSSLVFIRQLANKKSITVEYSSSPAAATIFADPKRLKQILVNLLHNAVKFTPEKGKVKLEVQADAKEGLMRFSVTDTGIGIDPEDIQKLFKPFVQLDSSLSRQYEGTGLGLTLVKKLVEMHGGSVELQSEFGGGSCFAFVLPWNQKMKDNDNHDLFDAKSEKLNTSVDTITTVRGKILLVEDNKANIMVIKDYLGSSGYQVFVASDGAEALSKAEETSPDIILMDIQMPHVNGLEATRRLRADPRFASVPIIALTAFAMPGDRERCLEAGMGEYLSKPVKLKELKQMIEKFLGHTPS